ncbi:MAG: alpha/beta hydrolase [Bacteroidales bacterium]|nr:alpha/beta hydrolase [Bacteroidales bacterium]
MLKKSLIFSLLVILAGTISAQETVALWQGQKVRHGEQVTLTPFLADNNENGISIIVCPGGSYFWLDDVNEGEEVAEWLQNQGISAFVLRYRAAGFGAFFWHHRRIFRGKQHPDMLEDAQQAIKYLKEHSEEYKIDPNRLGIIGFSAGGHLALMTACFSDKEDKPAFVAAIYPVVTMNEPYAHERSRRALLSERKQNNQTMRDSLSIEKHIPNDCPHVFVINCVDDETVDYHNSMLLDSALTAKKIEHKYIQYQTGDHGFGVSEVFGTKESRQWKHEFLKWLKETKL